MDDEQKKQFTITPDDLPQPDHDRYEPDSRVIVKSRRDSRSLAFHYVYAVDRFEYDVSLDTIVSSFKEAYNIEVNDNSFSVNLARGAIEHRDEFDQMIVPFLQNWKLERLGCATRIILRMGLWELTRTQEPHSVVINEAVELAKSFAERDSYRFVNGLIDQIYKKTIDPTRLTVAPEEVVEPEEAEDE